MIKENMMYAQAIDQLRQEKNAIILAHYYQEPAIQEIADEIGDSLALAKKAQRTDADIIVFAGVYFMAETAKILNPGKKVLLPDTNAGCSLADACPVKEFRAFINLYPGHTIITYINSSAEVKALSDHICTSSNALSLINSLPEDEKIIFAPDKNLGKYLMKETGRNMVLWDGSCVVHEAFSFDKLLDIIVEEPDARILAHPESEPHILQVAHFIGSTAKLLDHVKKEEHHTFIIATEHGILHQMQKAVPHKKLIPAPAEEDNTCACSQCAFMKVNTIEKLYWCLKNEKPGIVLSDELQETAKKPLDKMLGHV